MNNLFRPLLVHLSVPHVFLVLAGLASLGAIVADGARDPFVVAGCAVAAVLAWGTLPLTAALEAVIAPVLNETRVHMILLERVATTLSPPTILKGTQHIHNYVHRSTEWGQGMQRKIFVCVDPDCGNGYILSSQDDPRPPAITPPNAGT